MKKNILMVVIALTAFTAKAQQQPQEPTTFFKHDTVKVVLHTYADTVSLEEKKVRAFKVVEVRKGDQTGQYYGIPKKYLDQEKKPLSTDTLAVYQETNFPWADKPAKTQKTSDNAASPKRE